MPDFLLAGDHPTLQLPQIRPYAIDKDKIYSHAEVVDFENPTNMHRNID